MLVRSTYLPYTAVVIKKTNTILVWRLSTQGFLKTDFVANLCFLHAFTCFTPGVEPNWARSPQSTCDTFVRGI